MSTLYRASAELSAEGRTLIGLALPWERPALVSDFGGPKYLEDFARSSTDVTLRQNPEPRPVFNNHGVLKGDSPVGIVHYERAHEGLLFRAFLSRTRAADELLELANDGAMRDASVGFDPLRSTKVRATAGMVTRRTEIRLKELSIAPTGYGQIPGARVLAIRSDVTFDEITEGVQDALALKLFGVDGPPDGVYIYVKDVSDSWAVYGVEGGKLDTPQLGFFRVSYSVLDGKVTIGDNPEPVTVAYVPLDTTARSSIVTPRLDRWRRSRGL